MKIIIATLLLFSFASAKAADTQSQKEIFRQVMADPVVKAAVAQQRKYHAKCTKPKMGPSPLEQNPVIDPDTTPVYISCLFSDSSGDESETDITVGAIFYEAHGPMILKSLAFDTAD